MIQLSKYVCVYAPIYCILTDIKSYGFKVEVLGANAVQVTWDRSQEWKRILSYHIYYK